MVEVMPREAACTRAEVGRQYLLAASLDGYARTVQHLVGPVLDVKNDHIAVSGDAPRHTLEISAVGRDGVGRPVRGAQVEEPGVNGFAGTGTMSMAGLGHRRRARD